VRRGFDLLRLRQPLPRYLNRSLPCCPFVLQGHGSVGAQHNAAGDARRLSLIQRGKVYQVAYIPVFGR